MNAIAACRPDSAEDTMQMLQELIENGMQLARAAAKKALQHLTAPEPAVTAEGAAASRAKNPDPSLLFLRLWTSIRQSMSMQARLAAGPKPQARPANRPAADTMRHRLEQELGNSAKAVAKYTTNLSSSATTPPFSAASKI